MKRIVLSIFLCMLGSTLWAQIKPPQQTDTLIITSIKYNFAEIREENWPCGVIYKSTTSFRIGEDEFAILRAEKFGSEVTFTVTGDNGETRHELVYEEKYSGEKVIEFSGYEFVCKGKEEASVYVYEPAVRLAGRSINGTAPKFTADKPGTVVVSIWVDNYGNVQKALPAIDGTTIADDSVVASARKAALSMHFNMSADAPAMQEGVVTFSIQDGEAAEDMAQPLLVDVRPSFRGGDANQFSKWVNSHLVYPKKAKKAGVQGRVTLAFTIAEDGTVVDVRVLRGINEELDNEAVRVVSSSPKWTPAQKDGQPVAVTYTFPVIFQCR